jgi:DNA-binding transcriptional regulator YhcF (GntR family)
MDFNKGKTIFLQIADIIMARILKKVWLTDDKIPSVRELAIELEVNPNTVMRTYSYLEEKGVIYNKRGLGFFVAEESFDKVLLLKKKEFTESHLPEIFKTMDMLKIPWKELQTIYGTFKKNSHLTE